MSSSRTISKPVADPKPGDLPYWYCAGRQDRERGQKRDDGHKLPICDQRLMAWFDGWDSRDRELLRDVGYQRRVRAIERVERRRAAKLASDMRGHIGRILYEAASKGS